MAGKFKHKSHLEGIWQSDGKVVAKWIDCDSGKQVSLRLEPHQQKAIPIADDLVRQGYPSHHVICAIRGFGLPCTVCGKPIRSYFNCVFRKNESSFISYFGNNPFDRSVFVFCNTKCHGNFYKAKRRHEIAEKFYRLCSEEKEAQRIAVENLAKASRLRDKIAKLQEELNETQEVAVDQEQELELFLTKGTLYELASKEAD